MNTENHHALSKVTVAFFIFQPTKSYFICFNVNVDVRPDFMHAVCPPPHPQ